MRLVAPGGGNLAFPIISGHARQSFDLLWKRALNFPQANLPGPMSFAERGIVAKENAVNREIPEIRDLSGLLKDSPPGAWVALSHDEKRVLGTALSMQAAAYQAQLSGEEHPVLVKMPLEGEGLAAGVR